MDPNNHEQSGLRLPEPLTGTETMPTTRPEKVLSVSPEVLLGQPQPPPSINKPVFPMPPTTTNGQAVSQLVTTKQITTPSWAGDTDLIEKEWVIKAKAIVERTKDDPYQQKSEISRFKADYLKKRYNKDIKVSSNEG